MVRRREGAEGGLEGALPEDAGAFRNEARSGSIRWLCVAALATAAGCGGYFKEIHTWPEPIAVSGTTELELRPPVIIPSIWWAHANLELCFEMSAEVPGSAGGLV